MTMDDRRNEDRHTPERRHDADSKTTILGCALGLAAAVIVLFLAWALVNA